MNKPEEEIGWKQDQQPSEDQTGKRNQFVEGDSPEAKCRREVSEKMDEIRAKGGKLEGAAETVGRVWLFPRS